MEDKTLCPICGSEETYWQLSGALTCKECNIIYKSITKETLNNEDALIEAKRIFRIHRKCSKRCICCGKELALGEFARNQEECWDCCSRSISATLYRMKFYYPSWLKDQYTKEKELILWMATIVASQYFKDWKEKIEQIEIDVENIKKGLI